MQSTEFDNLSNPSIKILGNSTDNPWNLGLQERLLPGNILTNGQYKTNNPSVSQQPIEVHLAKACLIIIATPTHSQSLQLMEDLKPRRQTSNKSIPSSNRFQLALVPQLSGTNFCSWFKCPSPYFFLGSFNTWLTMNCPKCHYYGYTI